MSRLSLPPPPNYKSASLPSTSRQHPLQALRIVDYVEEDDWEEESAAAHGVVLGTPRPMPEALKRLKSISFDQYEIFYYPTFPEPCWGSYPFSWLFYIARRGEGPVNGIIEDWRNAGIKETTQGIGSREWVDIGLMLMTPPSKRVRFEYSVVDESGRRKVVRYLLFPCRPEEAKDPIHYLEYWD